MCVLLVGGWVGGRERRGGGTRHATGSKPSTYLWWDPGSAPGPACNVACPTHCPHHHHHRPTHHYPTLPWRRTTEALVALAHSAPFQQQLATLSHALQTGQLDLTQFGLQAAVRRAREGGGLPATRARMPRYVHAYLQAPPPTCPTTTTPPTHAPMHPPHPRAHAPMHPHTPMRPCAHPTPSTRPPTHPHQPQPP